MSAHDGSNPFFDGHEAGKLGQDGELFAQVDDEGLQLCSLPLGGGVKQQCQHVLYRFVPIQIQPYWTRLYLVWYQTRCFPLQFHTSYIVMLLPLIKNASETNTVLSFVKPHAPLRWNPGFHLRNP